MAVPFIGPLVGFVVALLIGGFAIYLGARFVVEVDDYGQAVVTALVGAVAWAVTAWVPLFGPIIALIAWVAVINWRYPGGWVKAALIGGVAWLAALVILFLVNAVFGLGVDAFGVPGA